MSTRDFGIMRSVGLGAILTMLAAFPVAAILGLVFRFPVPFNGIEGGISHVLPSLYAVVVYGLMGGFILLAILGAIGGAIAWKVSNGNIKVLNRLLVVFSISIAAVTSFVLSILDWIIGPW